MAALDGVEDAERDQVAIGRGVGDVPSGREDGGGKGPPHPTEIVGALRHDERHRQALPMGIGRRQQDVIPGGVVSGGRTSRHSNPPWHGWQGASSDHRPDRRQ